ncbi:MAG: hypothetical protein RBR09_11120, partial [Desulfobulbaceae bacterium]|nr:hypothetical protein [Desulfobulbaceae bacterium]
MKYCRYLLYGLLAMLVGGCGQTVKESLKVPPALKSTAGAEKSIVILPFADYSYGDDLETAYRRNLSITENLTDQLVSNSFRVSVQEDVFGYLVSQNIINAVAYEGGNTSVMDDELQDEWSPTMKAHLQRYMNLSKKRAGSKPVLDSPGTHALTQQEVVKIGRYFEADYIIRGRIVEYKTRQDPSWSPLKKGVLTFISGATSKLAWGNASADKYDMYGSMIAGALWGGILGSNAEWPWEQDKADQTILGISGGDDANTIFWGLAGAEFGRLGHKSGENPQAAVQMRVWVQDAYSGDVIWTNRVDVKVSSETVFGDTQLDALFESATEKAIATLMDNFVTQAL